MAHGKHADVEIAARIAASEAAPRPQPPSQCAAGAPRHERWRCA